MFQKGGKFRISSNWRKLNFNGSLFIFGQGILVTRAIENSKSQFTEIFYGMYEWRNLSFNNINQEIDKHIKEISILHQYDKKSKNKFKFRKEDGSNVYDYIEIMRKFIKNGQEIQRYESNSSLA